MGKRTAIRTKHAPHFYFIFAAAAILVGVFGTIIYTTVFAQGTEMIYACVHKNSGDLRIVTATESCKSNETALNWNKQGPAGPQGEPGSSSDANLPFICSDCALFPFAEKFRGHDFSNAQISDSDFQGSDLTEVNFSGSLLRNTSFKNTNLTNANFSKLAEKYLNAGFFFSANLYFNNANLTNATLEGSIIHSFDFRSANIQNANFSNTTIRQSNFSGAQNASTANFTGATWDNVTCPDGTKSGNNGNTCEGHL